MRCDNGGTAHCDIVRASSVCYVGNFQISATLHVGTSLDLDCLESFHRNKVIFTVVWWQSVNINTDDPAPPHVTTRKCVEHQTSLRMSMGHLMLRCSIHYIHCRTQLHHGLNSLLVALLENYCCCRFGGKSGMVLLLNIFV